MRWFYDKTYPTGEDDVIAVFNVEMIVKQKLSN